jgi:hypothetical protein
MWDTPPLEKMKMTRWALAGKCGGLGASGIVGAGFSQQVRHESW